MIKQTYLRHHTFAYRLSRINASIVRTSNKMLFNYFGRVQLVRYISGWGNALEQLETESALETIA